MAFAVALPSNSKTRPERVTKGKPSSLVGLAVSDEGKKFYNIDTRTTPKTKIIPKKFPNFFDIFE